MTIPAAGTFTEAFVEAADVRIQLRPRSVMAHFNLGVTLAKQGRLAEAREHFSEVLRLDPNHAAARRFLTNMANP